MSRRLSAYVTESIKIIRAHQHPAGAIIACSTYPAYRYVWLRDGTFAVYALDRMGEHGPARRFYEWCSYVLLKHQGKAQRVMEQVRSGKTAIDQDQFLHTRYTIDGDEGREEWGNFQLDGYGVLLWGIAEHLRMSGGTALSGATQSAVELIVDYLLTCWRLPCFDCWEELGDRFHPATLAAVYGGLAAIVAYLPQKRKKVAEACEAIRQYVLQDGVRGGKFVKSIGHPGVDASLLWLSVPFRLVEPEDGRMTRTVRQMEQELVRGQGVHRYPQDLYYGGGQWLLLSAWLGWFYLQVGERPKAVEILDWMETKWSERGLPEQVQDVMINPDMYDRWTAHAGPPACPLVWSHAMYLVLMTEVEKKKPTFRPAT
ncbi:glycoside hydrolase family 15 protein [Brevibacillus humidisoli]|uniref:glycoside hydrolase family 15 protein n=1 Tax=Brevibacillus humidisoli TaxID=2895522 RepID=UPI001E653F45|nr:glycoside hydrolase family 15 protein [Brevibacillus humidisoli]UFJ39395.1 glycoside hydrolase family 15 protein [Brevibacillus humidisoli]